MVTAHEARRLLAKHGDVRRQSATDWAGTFAIPRLVEEFYRDVGPVDVEIRAYGNPYVLPSLASLWDRQAGYRWNGSDGKPIKDWADDWIVIADEGGDPFIFVRSTGVVLHAYHGEGKWHPTEIFSDLCTMAACLAQIGILVRDAGEELTEHDGTLRAKFRELAYLRLKQLLGTKSNAEVVLSTLGWR